MIQKWVPETQKWIVAHLLRNTEILDKIKCKPARPKSPPQLFSSKASFEFAGGGASDVKYTPFP